MKRVLFILFKIVKFILKPFIILFCVVVGGYFIAPTLLEEDYEVKRSIEINAPAPLVFKYLTNFQTRHHWDPWIRKDSAATVRVKGNGSTKGSTWTWQGNKIGEGRIIVQEVAAPKYLLARVQFRKNTPLDSHLKWECERTTNGTLVTWSNWGSYSYPEQLYGVLAKITLGADFERGLKRLKSIVEKKY